MRTLITGGAGFLGSHLCDYLMEKGHDVICIDNLLTGSSENIEHCIGNPKFKFIKTIRCCQFVFVPNMLLFFLHG